MISFKISHNNNIFYSMLESEEKLPPNPINRSYFNNVSFFSKQFCLPKEIKLVDYQENTGRQIRNNIQIVDRLNHLDSNPVIRDIFEISISQENSDPGDGLISLLKHLDIKVTICITVYTEDKSLLKRSIQGIMQNYKHFYEDAGIGAHQIAVVIMFDGIQYLNNSKQSNKNMLNLFRQYDLINGFRKKQYIIAKEKHQQEPIDLEESELLEIENFSDQMLFTEGQYEQLEAILLESQFNHFRQMRELIDFGSNLERKKILAMDIDQLPPLVREVFARQVRLYLQSNGITQVTENNDQLELYIQSNLPQERIEALTFDALSQSLSIARQYMKSRQNTALMYQISLPLQYSPERDAKINIFPVVKFSNRGKLSSHLWFFQGFCSMIQPSVCVLMDCGLQPQKDAIFKMWAHIQTYKMSCGGVCGYMKLRRQSPYDEAGNMPEKQSQSCITSLCSYFFDIQKSQIFEYHFGHLLDKPFESLTGYIHVLPGAFSGYNWDALKSEKFRVFLNDGQTFEKQIEKRTKQQILRKYLKTLIYNETLDDIAEANMYLSQDRILGFSIYTKRNNKFCLDYLPDARASVDPILTLPRLVSQRKRWINGSWFALEYVLRNKNIVSDSDHGCWEKLLFHFNMFYASIVRVVAYLSLCIFFVTMHLMVLEFSQTTLKQYFKGAYNIQEEDLVHAKIFQGFFSIRSVINAFTMVIDFLYIVCLGILVYHSLTIRKQTTSSKRTFNTIASWLGILGLFFIVLIFINFYQALFTPSSNLIVDDGIFTQQTFIYLLIGIVGAHVIVVLSALNCYTYYEILVCMLSYFFYAPAYINLFFVYSFCRIDDLSWGTKGLDAQSKAKQTKIRVKFSNDKINFCLMWLMTNIFLSLFLAAIANNYEIQNYIIWIFSAYFVITLFIKTTSLILHMLQYHCWVKCKVNSRVKQIKDEANQDKKKKVEQFIKRMKQKQIDEHVQELNEELLVKSIFQNAYQNKQNTLKNMQNHGISFQDLQRINNLSTNSPV